MVEVGLVERRGRVNDSTFLAVEAHVEDTRLPRVPVVELAMYRQREPNERVSQAGRLGLTSMAFCASSIRPKRTTPKPRLRPSGVSATSTRSTVPHFRIKSFYKPQADR
jgi:hypothetical protein